MDYRRIKKRERQKRRGITVSEKPDISAPKRRDSEMSRYYSVITALLVMAVVLGAGLIYHNAYRLEDSFHSIKESIGEKLQKKEDKDESASTDEDGDGFTLDMGDIDLPDEIKVKDESEEGEESEAADESEPREYSFDALPTVEPPNTYR